MDRDLATIFKPKASKWGKIPWNEFDQWYTELLIDNMSDIRLDIGMYRRIANSAETTQENREICRKLIKSEQNRLYLLKAEIENERFRQQKVILKK